MRGNDMLPVVISSVWWPFYEIKINCTAVLTLCGVKGKPWETNTTWETSAWWLAVLKQLPVHTWFRWASSVTSWLFESGVSEQGNVYGLVHTSTDTLQHKRFPVHFCLSSKQMWNSLSCVSMCTCKMERSGKQWCHTSTLMNHPFVFGFALGVPERG